MTSVEQVQELMQRKENLRNLSVIAHVDHGKSTLTDSLVQLAGLSTKNRFMDTTEEEQQRGITISATGVTLPFTYPTKDDPNTPFLFNLIDSPGHVDFSSEVSAALRVTDGALVVVDCIEGTRVQTETVLRQALQERIKPALVLNKIDRAIVELQLTPEETYQKFQRTIESVNAVIATFAVGDVKGFGNCLVDPQVGNVAFASGLQGWGFTLESFARLLGKKLKKDPNALIQRLWGDWFYDHATSRWEKTEISPKTGKKLQRGFCEFVLDPIFKLMQAIQKNNVPYLKKVLPKLRIDVKSPTYELTPKAMVKVIMPNFLPLGVSLVEMIVKHLPSPHEAQRYRVPILYEGPMDDECAIAMKNCDPSGPLMIYISKLISSSSTSKKDARFYAYGRVFSGTVSSGQTVHILGPSYVPGNKKDLYIKSVSSIMIAMGRTLKGIGTVPCGNTVCLGGIDSCLSKSGTVTTSNLAHNFKMMKFSVSPVVRVGVTTKKPADLPKLMEGLKKLTKVDPCVEVTKDPSGQHIVAGAGELHLEVLLKKLKDLTELSSIVRTDPVVAYRETVTAESDRPCLAKSRNKLNRIWMKAEPLGAALERDLDKGIFKFNVDKKERNSTLVKEYDWNVRDTKKLWAFGPSTTGNVLVDGTSSVAYLNEVKDSLCGAFHWASSEGVLCGEPMKGIRFNIIDAMLHSDSAHRGDGQLLPAMRKVMYACELTAQPRLEEPMYLVELQVNEEMLGGIYNVMVKRRGQVFQVELQENARMYHVKAYLPVMESFGLTAALRESTKGKVFHQCVFDHWSTMESSPFNDGVVKRVVTGIRERKGLSKEIPELTKFLDKL